VREEPGTGATRARGIRILQRLGRGNRRTGLASSSIRQRFRGSRLQPLECCREGTRRFLRARRIGSCVDHLDSELRDEAGARRGGVRERKNGDGRRSPGARYAEEGSQGGRSECGVGWVPHVALCWASLCSLLGLG
jgi:hypothetical protein